MSQIDQNTAYEVCCRSYERVFDNHMAGQNPIEKLSEPLQEAIRKVFSSSTQSYREALLGCAVAKVCTPSVDVRKPYLKQGEYAFSGRTLDEKVINRFLRNHQIPCSKGAYLATFRRNVPFTQATGDGLRDKDGYDSMLLILDELSNTAHPDKFVDILMYGFIVLRDQAKIKMMQSPHLPTAALPVFIRSLLSVRSGGRIPLFIAEAFFRTINDGSWSIAVQGINDSDMATDAVGDIVITRSNEDVIGVEITERPIDSDRVRDAYTRKISLHPKVRDYIFVYTGKKPADTVNDLAKVYHQQGCNVSFINLIDLIIPFLIVGGDEAQMAFLDRLSAIIAKDNTPASIKAAWNDAVEAVVK